jgi:hypothetical protein
MSMERLSHDAFARIAAEHPPPELSHQSFRFAIWQNHCSIEAGHCVDSPLPIRIEPQNAGVTIRIRPCSNSHLAIAVIPLNT